MANTANHVIFFDVILSILLLTYGANTGLVNLSVFNSINTPALAPQPGNINCNQLDYLCNASKGIAQATAYIGWAVVNGPVLFIYFISVILLFVNLILQITFSPSFSDQGVPFLGFIWLALQLYVLWDVINTFRGSPSGV